MIKKYLNAWTLLLPVIGGISFNSPSTLKDVVCGDVPGKFWFVYTNTTTPVQEDSDNAAQEAAAKLATNYVRLQGLESCDGDQLLCAICASPQAGAPNRPQIAGQPIATEIEKYVRSTATHNAALIIEHNE